jgi:hypothetical protein
MRATLVVCYGMDFVDDHGHIVDGSALLKGEQNVRPGW